MSSFFTFRKIIIFFLVFITINLLVLDYKILKPQDSREGEGVTVSSEEQDGSSDQSEKPTQASNVCPTSCLSEIYVATSSLQLTNSSGGGTQIFSTGAKEFFVPFGSGSSTASTWTDVPGLQAYVDSTKYGSIKQVVFEISLYTPTGNQTANARLFNETAGHPVWNSDVSIQGGTPQLLISSPITLDQGSNLYQVQMQTQLQFTTNVDQARLHITTY